MKANGFKVGQYNPCTYFHPGHDLRALVHGDDFVAVGDRHDCEWFKAKLGGRFEIKTKLVGFQDDEEQEERILNRVIRATPSGGWEIEADQRHADIIVKELNLKEANGVRTPCEDLKAWEQEENQQRFG